MLKVNWYIAIAVVLIVAIFISSMKGEDKYSVSSNEIENISKPSFSSSDITYSIEIDTLHYVSGNYYKANDEYEESRVRKALRIIEEQTFGVVRFREVGVEDNPNIVIRGVPPREDRPNTEGEAGPVEFGDDGKIILSEVILYPRYYSYYDSNKELFFVGESLYESTDYVPKFEVSWKVSSCEDFPLTEIHEILHAFGFGHNFRDSYNVMASIKHEIQSCKINRIDDKTVACLIEIYNQSSGDACEGLDLYPWEEEPVVENFKWQSLPVSYSVQGCKSGQVRNLVAAENIIESAVGYDLYNYTDSPSSVNFYCNFSSEEALLNQETDFWDTGVYFPAAQPYYEFENEEIKKVNIYLFADSRVCGGIEVHEMLHALGFREHNSPWLLRETNICSSVRIKDDKIVAGIKEAYGLA